MGCTGGLVVVFHTHERKSIMNLETLGTMAESAYKNLAAARTQLFTDAENAIEARSVLESEKAQAMTAGKFDGKNAETREAQAREFLKAQYLTVTECERQERRARFDFDRADIDVDTVKILLRIAELGGK